MRRGNRNNCVNQFNDVNDPVLIANILENKFSPITGNSDSEVYMMHKNPLYLVVVVVDVTTLKMARKPMKLQKENLAGCAGEGK